MEIRNGICHWESAPPLMAQISRHFFTPLFFFCKWIANTNTNTNINANTHTNTNTNRSWRNCGRQVLKSDRIDDSWFRLTSQIWLQGHSPICSVADIIWDVEILNMWKRQIVRKGKHARCVSKKKIHLKKAVIPFINQKRHLKQKLHILTTATMHLLILKDENFGCIAHSTDIVCKQNLNKQCKNCERSPHWPLFGTGRWS